MQEFAELIKSVVRPFIIMLTWFTLCYMWVYDLEVPILLSAAGYSITAEYVGERAIMRYKEIKG
jgi:hypothetical protein